MRSKPARHFGKCFGLPQLCLAHLLLLMGDVLAFARLAHAVALDSLGEDHGGLGAMRHRGRVGGVDLLRWYPKSSRSRSKAYGLAQNLQSIDSVNVNKETNPES